MISIFLKCFYQTLLASAVAAFLGGFVFEIGADLNTLLKGSTIFFFIIVCVEFFKKRFQSNDDCHR